jgi:hypothetical protein
VQQQKKATTNHISHSKGRKKIEKNLSGAFGLLPTRSTRERNQQARDKRVSKQNIPIQTKIK